MFGALARKIFGSANDRVVKGYARRLAAINALEPQIAALDDDALRAKTAEFRERLADGASEPSFSPNGKYIMYATKGGGRTSLAVVSVDGRVKQRLTTQAGNIREPSWGPFMK